MGVGNYFFTNSKHFASSDYHIEGSDGRESYEDLCQRVVTEAKSLLLANPGSITNLDANLTDADIDQCVDMRWLKSLDDPMDGDSPLSVIDSLRDAYYGEESYYQIGSDFRMADFNATMQARLSAFPGLDVYVDEPAEAGSEDFRLIADGVFAAVGLKHWESNIYVGVVPQPSILNYETVIHGEVFDPSTGKDKGLLDFSAMQKLFARAALSIEDADKFLHNGYDRKPDLQRIAGMPDSGGISQVEMFGSNFANYQCYPEGAGEALIRRAEDAIESGEEADFEKVFGVSASDVHACAETLFALGEVMAETGHLPQAIKDGYQAEFDRLDVVVRSALFEVAPGDVYAPSSGWTSSRALEPSQDELLAASGPVVLEEQPKPPADEGASLSR